MAGEAAIDWSKLVIGMLGGDKREQEIARRAAATGATVRAQVVGASAQRARRARRDEDVVDVPLQRLVDLAHRPRGVRLRVGRVGVLIRPERVRGRLEQPRDEGEAGREQVTRRGIRLGDDAH